jgi:hypothetical protein
MGIYLRILPGIKIRLTRRGVRLGPGPGATRIHLGSGGRGVSTGAGPFTAYWGLRRRRRRRWAQAGAPAGYRLAGRSHALSQAAVT